MHLQVQVEAGIFVMFHSRCEQKFRKDKRKISQEHPSFIKLGGVTEKILSLSGPAGAKVEGAGHGRRPPGLCKGFLGVGHWEGVVQRLEQGLLWRPRGRGTGWWA